jgi:hypothetical protein
LSVSRLRSGELLALAGAACVIVALLEPWYQAPAGNLDAWDTFGPGVVLLLAATCAALALVVGTLGETSAALPISLAVWTVLLGLAGVVAAIVRVLERPQHASALCAGPWLALGGTIAILLGAWLSLHDERTSRFKPVSPPPRPLP